MHIYIKLETALYTLHYYFQKALYLMTPTTQTQVSTFKNLTVFQYHLNKGTLTMKILTVFKW